MSNKIIKHIINKNKYYYFIYRFIGVSSEGKGEHIGPILQAK